MLRPTLLGALALSFLSGACTAHGTDLRGSLREDVAVDDVRESGDVGADADDGATTGSIDRGGRIPKSERYPSGNPEMGRGNVDGHDLVEGDIIAPPQAASGFQGINTSEGLAPKWPGGVVYFTIAPGFPEPERVYQAIKHWEANTPVRFLQRTNQRNYNEFFVGEGCYANLGMVGGKQPISLAAGCTTGNSVHEIGHALGILHEQARSDRDKYIKILEENIDPAYIPQFAITRQAAIGAFDWKSIMLYDSFSFSKNQKPSMTRLDGTTFPRQREGLSAPDIAGVNTLYAAEFAKVVDGRVDLRWPVKTPTAEYSLDVVMNDGKVIAPCVNAGSLGKLTAHAFTGLCISPNVRVDIAQVKEFKICSAENGNWANATCGTTPYTAGTKLVGLKH